MAGIQFAGCGEHQSGQRFLDSSDPRLIRHVASCETAGWGFTPLPAGKDQKLPQEFEDGVLISAEGAVPSSLDSIENNRHNGRHVPDYYRKPTTRGRFCGRYSVRGTDPKTGRLNFRRINCGSWGCSYCGPRKAKTARRAIREHAERLNLKYFLTLTIDLKKVEYQHKKLAVPHLRFCFNKFREYLWRKYRVRPTYISVVEFTQAGVPHLHIMIDRYIPQAWISETWAKLGGGKIVFIKQVTIAKVARYLSKYLTKELLLSAPKHSRRLCTSRDIKLFPKFVSGISWELRKSSIWHMLAENRMRDYSIQPNLFEFISLEFDEKGYLEAFQLHTDGCRVREKESG